MAGLDNRVTEKDFGSGPRATRENMKDMTGNANSEVNRRCLIEKICPGCFRHCWQILFSRRGSQETIQRPLGERKSVEYAEIERSIDVINFMYVVVIRSIGVITGDEVCY